MRIYACIRVSEQLSLQTLRVKCVSLLCSAQQAAKVHPSKRSWLFLPECFPGRSGQRADTRQQASRQPDVCVFVTASLALCVFASVLHLAYRCLRMQRSQRRRKGKFVKLFDMKPGRNGFKFQAFSKNNNSPSQLCTAVNRL